MTVLESQLRASELRRRLLHPANGRISSDLEVVSSTTARRQREESYDAIRRAKQDFERQEAFEEALREQAENRREVLIIAAAMSDDEPVPPTLPKVAEIIKVVCDRYQLNRNEMLSPRRQAQIVLPRQIAMYLAYELTVNSYPEIGRRFGGRDHTTVLHAVRKVKRLVESFPQLAAEILEIKKSLGVG